MNSLESTEQNQSVCDQEINPTQNQLKIELRL